MAALYMALADKTRLRLLNLMRDQEVCVGYFTEVLGDSQPKISRHLAYLRNAGIVEARREGKWMHYRIRRPGEPGISGVVDAALRSLAIQKDCRSDELKFAELYGKPHQNGAIELDIYAHADMSDVQIYSESNSAHNDLEEFLL